jgi:hypothetical protein
MAAGEAARGWAARALAGAPPPLLLLAAAVAVAATWLAAGALARWGSRQRAAFLSDRLDALMAVTTRRRVPVTIITGERAAAPPRGGTAGVHARTRRVVAAPLNAARPPSTSQASWAAARRCC